MFRREGVPVRRRDKPNIGEGGRTRSYGANRWKAVQEFAWLIGSSRSNESDTPTPCKEGEADSACLTFLILRSRVKMLTVKLPSVSQGVQVSLEVLHDG